MYILLYPFQPKSLIKKTDVGRARLLQKGPTQPSESAELDENSQLACIIVKIIVEGSAHDNLSQQRLLPLHARRFSLASRSGCPLPSCHA